MSALAGSVSIPAGATALLVEGVGACRREVRSFLAAVWVHASLGVTRRRVIAKGADTEEFVNDWMAQENASSASRRWTAATETSSLLPSPTGGSDP